MLRCGWPSAAEPLTIKSFPLIGRLRTHDDLARRLDLVLSVPRIGERTAMALTSDRINRSPPFWKKGKALRRRRGWKPHVINSDKNPAYGEAIAKLKKERVVPEETRHRQVKYLNNRLEGGHGKLKRLIKPMLNLRP